MTTDLFPNIAAFPARSSGLAADRLVFWTCVVVILAFSQCWVMLFTGPGPGDVDPSVSATARNVFFPIYLMVLALGALRPAVTGMAVLRAPLLMLLVLVAVCSMGWSIDPDTTSRRVISVVMTTLAGVIVSSRFSWPRWLEVLATAFAIVVVLCFILALCLPTYGRMIVDFPGAWRGVWGHKNLLGYYMSVGTMLFIAAAITNPARRWLWLGFAAAALVLIVMSTSKTSLVSCLIGVGCIGLVGLARRGPAGAIAAVWLLVTGVLVMGFLMYASPDSLFRLIGKDASFTGRTNIWTAVLRQIARRPWTGYGFGAVWDNTDLWGPLKAISKEQGFTIHEAHNTWLGLWLELGYLGLGAWALLFTGLWVRTIAAIFTRPAAYFAFPFLVVFSLHTFTETVALVQNDLIWLMFAATAAKLAWPEPTTLTATGREEILAPRYSPG